MKRFFSRRKKVLSTPNAFIKLLILAGFILILFCISGHAAESESELDEEQLVEALFSMSFEEFINVRTTTATGQSVTVSRAPAMASVITREQIRKMGAYTLLDVIRRIPGFSVSINNIGNNVIDVRGMKTYHGEKVLLMVDNHRLNELHSGGTAWSFTDITLDNVEKIEFIRGPGSALYGENAFSGVINVITQKCCDDNTKSFVSLAAGSMDTKKASIKTTHNEDDWSFSSFVNLFETDGVSKTVEQDVLSLSPLTAPFSAAPGKTDDWQKKEDYYFCVRWKNLKLNSRYLKKERGPFINITDALGEGSKRELDHFYTDLVWESSISQTLNLHARLFFDQHNWDNYWVGYPAGFLGIPEYSEDGLIGEPAGKFRTYGAEFILNIDFSDGHYVTLGSIFRQHKQYDIRYWANFNTTIPFPLPLTGGLQEVSSWGNWATENEENDWSIFAQDDWSINDKLSLTTGVRYDYYESFGEVYSPRAGLTWEISNEKTVKFLFGKAFRAPSYVERFTINNPAYVGTNDLDPEIVNTFETSMTGNLLGMHYDIAFYYSRYRQIIVLGEKPSPTAPAPYVNKYKATGKGIELTLAKDFSDKLTSLINYSHQSVKNDDSRTSYHDIPSNRGNVEIQWEMLENVFLNTHLYWCGSQKRYVEDTRDSLEGYELLNLSFLLKDIFKEGMDLQLSVRNVLDETYKDPAPINTIYDDFPRPGISAMLELRYSI